MEQLLPNIYTFIGIDPLTNVYALKSGDGLAIIDTSINAKSMDKLAAALPEHGFSLDDVRYILITHDHPDHIGGLSTLQSRTDAITVCHVDDAPVIRGEQLSSRPDPDDLSWFGRFMQSLTPVPGAEPSGTVDREVIDGDRLDDIFPGMVVVHLPGHSNGQIGFWLSDQRILIGGDVMMNVPLRGLTLPFLFVSPDWQAVHQSIRKATELEPKMLLLGHGKAITDGTTQLMQDFMHHHPAPG